MRGDSHGRPLKTWCQEYPFLIPITCQQTRKLEQCNRDDRPGSLKTSQGGVQDGMAYNGNVRRDGARIRARICAPWYNSHLDSRKDANQAKLITAVFAATLIWAQLTLHGKLICGILFGRWFTSRLGTKAFASSAVLGPRFIKAHSSNCFTFAARNTLHKIEKGP